LEWAAAAGQVELVLLALAQQAVMAVLELHHLLLVRQ
jgi:hypothetical protein